MDTRKNAVIILFELCGSTTEDADRMANSVESCQSVDPYQMFPLGAVWSGSTLFAQGYLSENLGSLQ